MTREPLRPLGLALVIGVLLLQVPYGWYVLYPFKLLGTWLHEGGHALAMIATGAGFGSLEIFADGSGLAYSHHAARPWSLAVIAPAGYMGAPLAGVILVALTSRDRARLGLAILGGALAVTAALSIANGFGQLAIGATGAAILVVAAVPRPDWHRGALALLAAQACVGALVDIRVLFQTTLVVDGQVVRGSDAHQMALATLGTDATWAVRLWATLWLIWSIAILYWVLRRLRRAALRARPPAAPSAPPGAPPTAPG